ncbi:MAG TPA: protein translocase subunit SecD [Gemmata sp.]|nr:protein translocase subunit SecD [Gemmata sp.]
MQRNFLRGFLICLIPCLLAGALAARLDKYRLGIDLAGGTILVYEVNLDRTAQRLKAMGENTDIGTQTQSGEQKGLTQEQLADLAAQIKRRIDPTDIKNVTVRPLGDRRLEIILPTGGASRGRENLTAEEIEETKRLISQMGVLEFRILANGPDDGEGIRAAEDTVRRLTPDQLSALARNGEPPPAPPGEYSVKIGDTEARVRYAWAELGPEERASLQLSNEFAGTGQFWLAMAGARDKVVFRGTQGGLVTDPAVAERVLFGRECTSRDQIAIEVAAARRAAEEGLLPKELVAGNDDAEIHKRILADPKAAEVVNPKRVEYFVLTRTSPIDSVRVGGSVGLDARVDVDSKSSICIAFSLSGEGPEIFGNITRRNKPSNNNSRQLAILLDDRVVSSATIQSEITTQGQITGKFERKYVERIVQILKSGALTAELREKPVSQNTIGATLGRDTIVKGTRAIGLAFVAVLVFMVFYYRFAGLVACVALFANLLLTVGFMVGVNAAFTLPGLAGLVLTLGIAVDANVLIYERLREERSKGANIATAIRNGYDRAFATIIDTHMTSIFTAIVLYAFGNDQLKGFAISLTVGLVISLFTSLYMTRLIFDYWHHKKWLTDLSMLRLFGKLGFHPMKYRRVFFSLTAALTVAGLALFLSRGDAVLNVDFRGGTVFSAKLKDGEERALTMVDGKPGFRELLGKQRQDDVLTATSARWENQPSGGGLEAKVYDFTIAYADKTTATVSLTEKPAGDTVEEMEASVVARARELPDVSVEQMFLSTDDKKYDNGKSKYFTVRTTEKQPELVRASLDRLMREGDKTLIAGATVQKIEVNGPTATLTFSEPTSEAYLAQLLDREFKKLGAGGERDSFKLIPASEPQDKRYTAITVSVADNPTFEKLKPGTAPAADAANQAAAFKQILDATKQAFDAAPEPQRLEVFDGQFAKDTREKAFKAILWSWVAILIYLWFRFGNWTFGLAAVLCLIHDLCFTLGAIALCHYLYAVPGMNYLGIEDFKIDFAAVAALLTLVGYSVSDTIVVFDRIREVRGKNPKLTPEMIDESVNQTLSRTILTATTVFLVSIVLYAFGGEGVHLFAFVMIVGVLVGTYSSIFVAAPLLLVFGEGREHGHTAAAEEADADKGEKEEEEVLEG